MAVKFKVEWHGKEVMKALKEITYDEERQAAQRILARAKKYVPVGTQRRPAGNGKSWQSRYPGRLKRSLKIKRSRFKDGGWLVRAGGQHAYHAVFVEYGTVFTSRQKFGRKGEKYLRRAVNLEKARFIRQIKKRVAG